MKALIQIFVAVLLLVYQTGCATPYMHERVADAKDILTATVGVGGGARARVGPLHAGLMVGLGDIGLRSGALMQTIGGPCNPNEIELIGYGEELFAPSRFPDYDISDARLEAKGYETETHFVPFVTTDARTTEDDESGQAPRIGLHPYWTQIDIQAGFLATVRLGFNPGELLDFILGWTTIDIFKDDLETQRAKIESNQPAQPTGKPAPGR
jgi:hypothetical protein